MRAEMGVSPECFKQLVAALRRDAHLTDSRRVTLEEQTGFLLAFSGNGVHMTCLADMYGYSLSTINTLFDAICTSSLYSDYVDKRELVRDSSNVLLSNPKVRGYFGDDCAGVVKGAQVNWKPHGDDPDKWRKGYSRPTSNMMTVCTFDQRFGPIFAGTPGTVPDQQVLDLWREEGFQAPQGEYYLGGSGLTMAKDVMPPYSRARYILSDWCPDPYGPDHVDTPMPPQNKKELFNLRHAGLCHNVDRLVYVAKRPFQWFEVAKRDYDHKMQKQILTVSAFLFNFINISEIGHRDYRYKPPYTDPSRDNLRWKMDELTRMAGCRSSGHGFSSNPSPPVDRVNMPEQTRAERSAMRKKRDEIADRMWADYQAYVRADGAGRRSYGSCR
ncbi:BQ2448_5650 [Microbotryum intermedium]|uniref:BQ2448_5650 protein n=1 Tax=Microbotryum intermedium TaxID=269621 RepID=A0A238F5D3_9BASI|nr:BQ2448_5650 [Microbotryum intermedium]